MAQISPKTGQPLAMSDLNYDLVTTLAEDLDSIEVLNTYIQDARAAGDPDVERIFTQIRDDELQHCDMLKKAIENRCRQGKFE